ncbi:MAG: glycosyltransferase family 39 protein [Planctomycetota bacterium]
MTLAVNTSRDSANSGATPIPGRRPCLSLRQRLLLAVLTAAVLLPGVFGVSLVDRDEGWYGQVSREMVASGDWLVPRYLGEPWLGKPPLLYWCVAPLFAVFGPQAWAGRLVSVLALAVAVQLGATLAAELYNRRVAVIAGATFITAGLPAIVGKLLLTDALLLAWCLAAMLLLWRIAAQAPTLPRCCGFWACIGLGLLTKGPAIPLFVGSFALGLLVSRANAACGEPAGVAGTSSTSVRGWLKSPLFWLTAPVALAIAAPWYGYIALHAGAVLKDQLLGFELAQRFVTPPHGHAGPPGYYVLVSLAGWLPWTVLVPGAFGEAWRARRGEPAARLLIWWCGLAWLILELIPGKLPHYILPCYVPLAIMLGRMWDNGLAWLEQAGRGGSVAGGAAAALTPGQRRVLGLWAVVPMAVGAGLVFWGTAERAGGPGRAVAGCGALLMAGFMLVFAAVRSAQLRSALRGAALTAVVFHVAVGTWLLPALEPYRLSRNVAGAANTRLPAVRSAVQAQAREANEALPPVLACGYTEPTLFFYLDEAARPVDGETCARAVVDDLLRVLIVSEEELAAAGLTETAHTGQWERIEGVNYVKGRREVVWVGLCGADSKPAPQP